MRGDSLLEQGGTKQISILLSKYVSSCMRWEWASSVFVVSCLELQELLSAEKSAADPLNASAQAPIRRFCSRGILHMDLEATEKGTGFCWIFVFYSLK